ncbi:MAG: hypothetical protein KKB59_14305 [Spirochaetes bacterium]|nr:hypothetical protein [Spirochaetota bacterium]
MKKFEVVVVLLGLAFFSLFAEPAAPNYAESWRGLPGPTRKATILGFYLGIDMSSQLVTAESSPSSNLDLIVAKARAVDVNVVIAFIDAYYSIETNNNNEWTAAFVWSILQASSQAKL